MTHAKLQSVLVIDDDAIHRELVAAHLRARDVTNIHMAADGNEAKAQISARGSDLDLILSDLNMPDFDGIEFLMHLNGAGLKAALIFISGAPTSVLNAADKLASIYEINYCGCLRKPLRFDALDKLLDRLPATK